MPAAILTRLVLLEARRSGLPWLAAGALVVGLGIAAFLSQVALTESRALQVSVLAAWLRASAVFLVTVQVVSSTMREKNDKGLELMLSLPLARSTHYLGRLAGFAALGAVLALAFCAPLLAWAAPAAVGLWGISLAFEATLAAAAALFFSMAMGQIVPAIAASVALYLLARSMAAIQAIAAGPLVEASWTSELAQLPTPTIATRTFSSRPPLRRAAPFAFPFTVLLMPWNPPITDGSVVKPHLRPGSVTPGQCRRRSLSRRAPRSRAGSGRRATDRHRRWRTGSGS